MSRIKFVIKKISYTDKWMWELVSNGHVIAESGTTYSRKSDAKRAMRKLQELGDGLRRAKVHSEV